MVGCLYIPDFPAWARQSQHPAWRAIAVYRRGEVIARTRLLEQSGLPVGESLERARSLFPKAHFIEQDQPFERTVWEGVVQRINEVTPFLSPIAHGWAFFRPYNFSEACSLSGALLACIGLGPNRSIARLSALRAASGSVLQVKRSAVGRFLTSTKVDVLIALGFEDAMVERLQLFGLTSLAHLERLSRRHLDVQFGTAGIALFDLLHPAKSSEEIPLYTPPLTISESFEMDGAPLDWLPLNHLIEQLARRAVRRLGSRLCRRITLHLKTRESGSTTGQRILKKPTANIAEIIRAADALLLALMKDTSSAEELTLSLGALRNPDFQQGSLFFERPSIVGAVSNLEERFPGSIRRAVIVNPDAPFPEDAVRYMPFVSGQYSYEASKPTRRPANI